ncbi:MAG: hypothetical protein U9N86_16960 [Bacteroidota bacterium]|nr:hypothetical protein [Bacteroidota bacterium]
MKKFRYMIVLLLAGIIPFGALGSIEVVGKLKHVYKGIPGQVFTGEIVIRNSSDKTQEVRVYQTDLLYNYQDYTNYDEDDTHPRSNITWINFSPKSAIVNANEVRSIQFEITIPADQKICGTYWSVLMVEGVNPIDPEQLGELNIKTVTRYAIQMVTDIVDQGTGLIKFLKPTLISEGDHLFLAVDLINEGQHYISPEVSMELFDEQGKSFKVIKASKKGLFPTTSARFRLDLEGLKGEQTYECLIIAAGQDEDVFGLEYTLYF